MSDVTEKDQADAEQQYGMKLSYEPPFRQKLKKQFDSLATDVGLYYAATGLEFNAGEYHQAFYDLLTSEYERIAKKFGNRLLENEETGAKVEAGLQTIADHRNTDHAAQVAAILAIKDEKIQQFIVQAVTQSTAQITDTNQKQIGESISEALSASSVDSPLTQKEVGAIVAKNMKTKTNGRVGTIAATETQNATEGSKSVEAETLNNYLIAYGVIHKMTKQWVTMGDQKVRPTHRSANGQKRSIGEPFHVGSSLLQEPRDESLGASKGETINCRCVTLYRIE